MPAAAESDVAESAVAESAVAESAVAGAAVSAVSILDMTPQEEKAIVKAMQKHSIILTAEIFFISLLPSRKMPICKRR